MFSLTKNGAKSSLALKNHRRRGVEQARELHLRRGLNLGEMLAFLFFVLARCFGQDTLYDVGHFSGIGTGF